LTTQACNEQGFDLAIGAARRRRINWLVFFHWAPKDTAREKKPRVSERAS
jgi:hypothetical protein